jgi:hypothetical protein
MFFIFDITMVIVTKAVGGVLGAWSAGFNPNN